MSICNGQRRRAEEAAELSDFQLSVAVSPTTPLTAQQSSPAAAIESKLYFPSVKYFMILGFWSGFGLTDSLRLSISDTNNHDACFNNSFDPSKYAVYWGHYYGPGNTNPKQHKNCECYPYHYLIVNHYSSMSRFKFRNLSVTVPSG